MYAPTAMNPAWPRLNWPLNPLMSCRLTARMMLNPISITTRWLYAPNHSPSTTRPSSTIAISAIGTGTFATAVSHQPDAGAIARRASARVKPTSSAAEAPDGALAAFVRGSIRLDSDLFDDMLAQQARGFDEQDDDQDHERDAVAILAAVGHVADDERFDEPEQQRADDRADDVADPAKHGRDECLHARQQAHQRLDLAIFHRVQQPGDRREARAKHERE